MEEKYNREEIPEIKKIICEHLPGEPTQSPILEIIGEYLKWTGLIGYHEMCDFCTVFASKITNALQIEEPEEAAFEDEGAEEEALEEFDVLPEVEEELEDLGDVELNLMVYVSSW